MSSEIFIVRQVDEAIVAAYARLLPQLNPAYQAPSAAQLQAIVDSDATELLLARDTASGQITGALALAVFTTPTGTHAWIEDVVVDAAWRKQGIGRALSLAAIHRAAERGAKAVDLTSRPHREAANQLYQELGFELRPSNLYRYPLPKRAS